MTRSGPVAGSVLTRQAAFDRMEREHHLFDDRFEGWSPWRVMRNAVHRHNLALPIASQNRSNVRRAWKACLESIRFAWLLLSISKQEVLVKTSRSGLRMQVGEQYRDVYFDGLLGQVSGFVKIEENNSPDFYHQAKHALFPSTLDPVFFTFWGTILGKLLPVDALPFCKRVSALLRSECGVEIDVEWLLLRVSTAKWQARLFGLLLRRVQPKAVLVADTGEYGLRIASLRQNIRFIELQHGVFDNEHPDAIPDWVGGNTEELLLPDILACRGEYWIRQLSGTLQGQYCARPVGNELIDLARTKRHAARHHTDLRMVVSSQGLDSTNLATWLTAMIASAPQEASWSLFVKLHPVYDTKTTAFEQLSRHPNVTIIGGAETPNVFDLLCEADIHLSIASACHFDALALGVRSVIIPLEGHEAMLSAVSEGMLALARTPEDVWAIAAVPASDKIRQELFSYPDFLHNMMELIPTGGGNVPERKTGNAKT